MHAVSGDVLAHALASTLSHKHSPSSGRPRASSKSLELCGESSGSSSQTSLDPGILCRGCSFSTSPLPPHPESMRTRDEESVTSLVDPRCACVQSVWVARLCLKGQAGVLTLKESRCVSTTAMKTAANTKNLATQSCHIHDARCCVPCCSRRDEVYLMLESANSLLTIFCRITLANLRVLT